MINYESFLGYLSVMPPATFKTRQHPLPLWQHFARLEVRRRQNTTTQVGGDNILLFQLISLLLPLPSAFSRGGATFYWFVSCNPNYVGISIKKFPHALALSFHQIYSSNWGHLMGLDILLKWWYGSLISTNKWLSDRPKCRMTSITVGTTQKAKKLLKV